MTTGDSGFGQGIAIIGMSGRFPGANTLEEYWQAILQGKDTITRGESLHPASQVDSQDPDSAHYIAARGVLADVESFDPGFFDFTPSEAAHLDPQQRTWLGLAYHALESAGYAHDQHNQIVSVFAGSFLSSYLYGNLLPTRRAVEEFLRMQHVHSLALMVQNDPSFLPSRTAYKLGLRGPAVNVQTACSTSLVAIAMGVQSLLSLESDIVIAGGVCVSLPLDCGYYRREGSIMSQDGTCRPYDSRSSGTVFSNGGGAVVLKRLVEAEQDGDPILAVLRGAAINNDGRNKVSFMAPSPTGQAEAIATALGLAEVNAETIGYVEGHGTGTVMGDPIEVEGLTRAFRYQTAKNGYCCLGSAKGNIGHLDAAAGVAGFIRAVLALRNRVLPPTAHFSSPNPAIDFANTPFYVLSEAKPWETTGHPRRAGVSSFGIGGTNAHVILEEYCESASTLPQGDVSATLRLSAKGAPALERATADLLTYVERKTTEGSLDLRRVEATLSRRRQGYPVRRALYVSSAQDALSALKLRGRWDTGQALDSRAKVFFAFPGQGSLSRETLSGLVASHVSFRKNLESISQVASTLVGFDVAQLCRTAHQCPELEANNTQLQVVLFCISIALARTLGETGVKADGFFGHSLGEWAAAHLSGQLSLEDAIKGVFHRGRLMSETGAGAALSVHLPAAALDDLLPAGATLACVNGSSRCLVSGRPETIAHLAEVLQEKGIVSRSIPINVAVHSPAMDGIIQPFSDVLAQLAWAAPSVPMLSSVTGDWFQSSPEANRKYFCEQLRAQVRFDLLLQTLAKQPACLIVEVGLGNTLSALASGALKDRSRFAAIPLVNIGKSPDESAFPLERIRGKLWAHGVNVEPLSPASEAGLGDLPPYSFERIRCWVDPPKGNPATTTTETAVSSGPISSSGSTIDRVAAIVAQLSGLPEASLDREKLLTDFGFESLFLAELAERLSKETGVLIDHSYLTYHGSIVELAKYIDKTASQALSAPAVADVGATSAEASGSLATRLMGVSFRGLIKLREGDGRLPLFLIHGDRANDFLSRLLPTEQPFYGYTHQGANGELIRLKSVETLAAHCLEEWIAVNGNAPCVLAGHSYGAAVAYHLAHLLRSRGVSVPHLYLLDGTHPYLDRYGCQFGLKWPLGFARNTINNLKELRRVHRAEKHHLRAERVPVEARPTYTVATYKLALIRYFPPSIDVETTLFRATENYSGLSHNGWKPSDFPSFRVVHVQGNHLEMVRNETIFRSVAEVLVSDLKRLRTQRERIEPAELVGR